METDFRAFILLLETITEIRRNAVFKTYSCWGSLFLLRVTDFSTSGNHFFLHFSETPTSDPLWNLYGNFIIHYGTVGPLWNLHLILPRSPLLTIYKLFVRPHYDYGVVV